jgi:hypothetical protein
VALRTADHHRDFAQFNSFSGVSLKQISDSVALTLSLFNMDIDFGVDLVSQVPDSRLVGEVRIRLLIFQIFENGLGSSVNLSKHHLVANVSLIDIDFACISVLLAFVDNIVLVLVDTVLDHVLDESIEGLDLLVDNAILQEVGVNNVPQVFGVDLLVSKVLHDSGSRREGGRWCVFNQH